MKDKIKNAFMKNIAIRTYIAKSPKLNNLIIKNYKGKGIPKIDLHVHYIPEAFREALKNSAEKDPDKYPAPDWNAEMHIETMKHLGIVTSLLSMSSPHINFGDQGAATVLCRTVNEEGADIVKKYPLQFGLLASLPLPDPEASIQEIRYAINVLNADGFALPTNTQGVYLGNPCLDPVFEELNKHKAVVVIHPNRPSSVPKGVVDDLPIPFMEFFFDTTRTVCNMILNGTLIRFLDIRFVVPHGGAVLPILIDRWSLAIHIISKDPHLDFYDCMKRLYFDVAGACLPRQLPALMQLVDETHLFYGSDYPHTPEVGCVLLADALDKTDLLIDQQRHAIYYENALKLFPRLSDR